MAFLFISLVALMGCGKSGGGAPVGFTPAPPTGSPPPGAPAPAKKAFQIIVTGDNVSFVTNSFDVDLGFPDHFQGNTGGAGGPVTIPVGGKWEYDVLAYNIDNLVVQVSNMNGAPKLIVDIYANGVHWTSQHVELVANGEWWPFPNLE